MVSEFFDAYVFVYVHMKQVSKGELINLSLIHI